MPSSEQKRQKKLAKQQTRAKKAKRELARKKQDLSSMAGKMRLASSHPIFDCKISALSGPPPYLIRVLFARRIAGGQLAMATFLLDCGCLGIKHSLGRYCTAGEYQSLLVHFHESTEMVDATPERVRALIEQTLAYAAKLGFAPHPDFQKAYALFGDVDASQCDEVFPMGDSEGKPIYINGPFEDAARQRAIVAQLAASVGEGNFHYIIGGPASGMQTLLGGDADEDFVGDELAIEDNHFNAASDINAPHWRRLE